MDRLLPTIILLTGVIRQNWTTRWAWLGMRLPWPPLAEKEKGRLLFGE